MLMLALHASGPSVALTYTRTHHQQLAPWLRSIGRPQTTAGMEPWQGSMHLRKASTMQLRLGSVDIDDDVDRQQVTCLAEQLLKW